MTPEVATAIALQGLTYLASDPETFGEFLAQSGIGPHDLRERMMDPELHGGILDTLMECGDDTLLAFCGENNLTPQDVMHARALLPGGLHMM